MNSINKKFKHSKAWQSGFSKPLKGYRIRVVVDVPIWEYTEQEAIRIAELTVSKCHSACLVIKSKCIRIGLPDSKDLFPEFLNPSKR